MKNDAEWQMTRDDGIDHTVPWVINKVSFFT